MKKIFKFIRNIIIICILALLAVAGYITYDGYKLYKEVIAKESIEQKVNEIKENEWYLSFDEIPKDFSIAMVSIEDHRFFKHNGVDIKSIGRAMKRNIKAKRLIEGGSTITQQLAKNMYFNFDKKFSRKVAEVFVTFDLEKKYKKQEILAMYINVIYFGNGYYGLNRAADGYFNKSVDKLTYDEITLLAGLPNAPSAFSLDDNLDLAKQRQKLVQDAINKFGVVLE